MLPCHSTMEVIHVTPIYPRSHVCRRFASRRRLLQPAAAGTDRRDAAATACGSHPSRLARRARRGDRAHRAAAGAGRGYSAPPSDVVYWGPGHWRWDSTGGRGGWTWIAGYYADRPNRTATWVDGHWQQSSAG